MDITPWGVLSFSESAKGFEGLWLPCHRRRPSGGITDQLQCRGLWHSNSPSARSLSRSPSSSPPSFTQSPSSPRSLVRDGQTRPHRPRLVVSRSTCPPLSPSAQREQLYNRYCSNKHALKRDYFFFFHKALRLTVAAAGCIASPTLLFSDW